jgi:uncharacterized membrane protein YgcG
MSNVNFHQYFSAELKEFHAILVYQQESYAKKLKDNSNNSEFDETETLVKLKESIDTASEFFRGFSDLLAEGKMEKIKMNIEAILGFINNSNNTYIKDYTKLFDEALDRLFELPMIIEPKILNEDGGVVFERNAIKPYELDVDYAVNNLNKSSYIAVVVGFIILIGINLFALNLMGDGFFASGAVLVLNIIYIFSFLFGFRTISTIFLKHQLAKETNESFVENVEKLISEDEPTKVAEIIFQNTNSKERTGKIREKRIEEYERQKSSFDKVDFNTPRRSVELSRSSNSQNSSSSSSSAHANHSSYHNSGYSSYDSSSDSSSSSCDGGSSSGGCD